jgi:LL-diaminopimelate aminotransferase
MRNTYQRRRDLFVDGINALGWNVKKPKGTMYVWMPVPQGYDATEFTIQLMKQTGVVLSPGVAFGDLGEGYVRAALVTSESRITEALERMQKAGIRYRGS